MENKIQSDLFDKKASTEFYDERYKQGYMENWPERKKSRIIQILRGLGLPSTGDALDYGCGNGVFTQVIKEALPAWNVYGSDISRIAIENAGQRYKDCIFFTAEDEDKKDKKYDLIFSHHVLEHVYDIDQSCKEISEMSKASAFVLHVLPCGNKDSLEYNICFNRVDGINKEMNNRFFYEDPGHLRRLTSDELAEKYKKYGFKKFSAYFSNQYYGALDWITNYDASFIESMTDLSKSKNDSYKANLSSVRRKLLFLYKAKSIVRYYNDRSPSGFIPKVKLFFAGMVVDHYRKKADDEWLNCSRMENGSEMYLCLKRP